MCVTMRLSLWKWGLGKVPSLTLSYLSWVRRRLSYGRVPSPPPGLTASVTPLILRKVLQESLPLLEIWAGRGGGRAEVRGVCGKSETVPSSRTVTIEQPHPTLAHWKRTSKSNRNTENPLRTKNWPMLGPNSPHFTVRTLKAPAAGPTSSGDPQQAAPGAPPSA